MSIDVEYAIKKDIRNNPVVREVDREQKREFRRTVWLAALLVGALLFSAWQHFDVVNSGYKIEKARAELGTEQTTNRQLRVAYETEYAPAQLEHRAIQELQMVPPTPSDTLVIEQVSAATAGKGIVVSAR